MFTTLIKYQVFYLQSHITLKYAVIKPYYDFQGSVIIYEQRN